MGSQLDSSVNSCRNHIRKASSAWMDMQYVHVFTQDWHSHATSSLAGTGPAPVSQALLVTAHSCAKVKAQGVQLVLLVVIDVLSVVQTNTQTMQIKPCDFKKMHQFPRFFLMIPGMFRFWFEWCARRDDQVSSFSLNYLGEQFPFSGLQAATLFLGNELLIANATRKRGGQL